MQLSKYQETNFLDRYSKRDQENKPTETKPEQMWRRVSDEIANTSDEAEKFYDLLKDFKFVPGGRILAGAGTESEKTYYNCYVIPMETKARRLNRQRPADFAPYPRFDDPGTDSREAIFDTVSTMVDIMSRGGGVGINWSVLRPANSYLTRVSGTSSGPVGWMDVASKAVGEVIQGGSRRGAAMFMLNDWHPDLEAFIEAKTEGGRIENANISVGISDEFMDAVRSGKTWNLRFPDTTHAAYNTEWDGDLQAWTDKGYPVKVHGRIDARIMWRKLASSAWRSGEPGVVFLGRYNALSTAQGLEKIISVNPCGEQGLGAYSVCNLGSMNLDRYVVNAPDGDPIFNWPYFERDVRTAVRFLDNVIDKTYYHLPESREVQMRLRRIGLGVMGLADALIKLGLRYGESAAVDFTERVFRTMKDKAIAESMQLARERGPALAWDDMMWDRPYLSEYNSRHMMVQYPPLRNLFLLTQAPTGTTSALAGVYGGIEPYFDLEWTRIDRTGEHHLSAPPGSTHARVTANDVSVSQHLLMQAAAQKYIDSSVSKTINAPKSQTEEETLEAYTMSYDLGLKGLAYYRDGSRDKQVLYRDNPNKRIAELEARIAELEGFGLTVTAAAHTNGFDTALLPAISFQQSEADACPSCGGRVVREEGCSKCQSCSWSAC